MRKIMFNDKYGLTKAVLDESKTMTRRFLSGDYEVIEKRLSEFHGYTKEDGWIKLLPSYQVGEFVAIAQSYKNVSHNEMVVENGQTKPIKLAAGWNNKMFVKTEYMPHNIQITNIKIERLQDISNENCLKEGISDVIVGCEYKMYGFANTKRGDYDLFKTPREAYSVLIDKISGKGTWESNPYVFVYEFKLMNNI